MALKCTICGNAKGWVAINVYDRPDKYEKWVGIDSVHRTWVQCFKCGFLQQIRNYPIWQLEHIYKEGYRNPDFRGESIEDAFKRITQLDESENLERYIWFASNVKYEKAKRVLDIGSGIGVWPAILNNADYQVTCVEENSHSIEFINKGLNIPCYDGLAKIVGESDTVTLVHVLEHMEEPDNFLQIVKEHLREDGYLFIEVPDADEFRYLKAEHDEFNSCHASFFDIANLYKLLERNDFKVTNIRRVHYEDRNLSRIMCLAINN